MQSKAFVTAMEGNDFEKLRVLLHPPSWEESKEPPKVRNMYESMKMWQLQNLCKQRHIPYIHNKNVLVDRLIKMDEPEEGWFALSVMKYDNPNNKNNDGDPPIHEVIKKISLVRGTAEDTRCEEMLRVLIMNGADLEARGNADTTALVVAVEEKWLEGVNMLLTAGADPYVSNARREPLTKLLGENFKEYELRQIQGLLNDPVLNILRLVYKINTKIAGGVPEGPTKEKLPRRRPEPEPESGW